MRTATVHLGLHKTGSTYIQAIAKANRLSLLSNDIYFREEIGYPAHHEQAWRLLRDDFSGIDRMIEEAAVTGVRDILISSEDLEALLFRPELAARLARRLGDAGYDQVVFAMYLRNPAESFWSLYSEISQHIYVDPIQMFCDAMRLGYVYIERPSSLHLKPPYWYFSFDHHTNIARFEAGLKACGGSRPIQIKIFDFHKPDVYMGRQFFVDLGVGDGIKVMPPKAAVNPRLSNKNVQSNYVGHVLKHLPGGATACLGERLVEHTGFTVEQRAHIAHALESRFLRGCARVLQRYREPGRSDLTPLSG